MKLYYHAEIGGNFGDDLNLLLWTKLLPDLFDGVITRQPQANNHHLTTQDILFLGIGTILDERIPVEPVKYVFGAGTGYGTPAIDAKFRFFCVRGPRTARRLRLPDSLAISDPAMLVPSIYVPRGEKRFRWSFMPHHSTAAQQTWPSVCARLGIKFIDPRATVTEVLDEIAQTETLISEALHGAIVADALRVPWIPVSSGHNVLRFKWEDWLDTVGLPYQPIGIPAIWGEPHGFVRQSIRRGKQALAEVTLHQIMRSRKPYLSADGTLLALNKRFESRLEEFRNILGVEARQSELVRT